jgi:hypothetical protein
MVARRLIKRDLIMSLPAKRLSLFPIILVVSFKKHMDVIRDQYPTHISIIHNFLSSGPSCLCSPPTVNNALCMRPATRPNLSDSTNGRLIQG